MIAALLDESAFVYLHQLPVNSWSEFTNAWQKKSGLTDAQVCGVRYHVLTWQWAHLCVFGWGNKDGRLRHLNFPGTIVLTCTMYNELQLLAANKLCYCHNGGDGRGGSFHHLLGVKSGWNRTKNLKKYRDPLGLTRAEMGELVAGELVVKEAPKMLGQTPQGRRQDSSDCRERNWNDARHGNWRNDRNDRGDRNEVNDRCGSNCSGTVVGSQ